MPNTVSTIDFISLPLGNTGISPCDVAIAASVKVEVGTVPILVRLSPDLFATPGAIAINPTGTSPGVELIRENGAVYYEIVDAPERLVRYFVQAPPFTGAKYLTLQMSTVTSRRLTISVEGTTPTYVSTSPSIPFSDDFGGTTYNRELWVLGGTPGSQANIGVASSVLTLTNPATPNVVTELRSDLIAGHELAEVRDVVESARTADAGYLLEFRYTSAAEPYPSAPSLARIGFNITPSTGLPKAVPDPTTTITFNACQAGVWGTDQSVALAAGGVTTTPHTYAIAFDGHQLHLLIDGAPIVTRTVRIPHADTSTLELSLRGITGAAPGGAVTWRTERVDVVTDLPLVVTLLSGVSISIPGVAQEATQQQVLAHVAQIDTTTLAILYAILHGGTAPAGHILLNFDFTDVPLTPRKIGTAPAGCVVHVVALIILTPFDQPVLLEVGRLAAPAELMLGADNNPAIVDTYHTQPDHLYAVATDVYLTLTAGGLLPTTGSGQVIVYLD